MSLHISATTALDRLPVAVSGRPPRSIACRSRIRVLRATGEPAISPTLRSLAIRIAVRAADGSRRSARRLSNVSNVQAGSTPSSQPRICGFCKKSSAPMAQPATPIRRETGEQGRSHSTNFDHRRRPEALRTAMATAFFCPTSTTSRLPLVTPVLEKIPLQHGVMLGEHRDYHGGIFRSLALVNGRRVGRHQHVQLTESISEGPAIEAHSDLACVGFNIADVADIAVVDVLFVIVFDLHHFVAGGKGPAEPPDLEIAGRIERCLQLDVQRPPPTPPRFIGHSTWMSRIGSRPNRLGIRVFTSSMIRPTAVAGSSACTK